MSFRRWPGLLVLLGSAGFWECRSPDHPLRFSEAMGDSVRTASGNPSPAGRAAFPEPVGELSEGLASFRQGGAYGYMDAAGRVAVTARFQHAGAFSAGRAPVLDGTRWGYCDASGEMIIPAAYDWAGPFREGRAAVATAGAHRFIDTAGDTVGSFTFSDARPFSGGLAAVRFGNAEEGAWGFIDLQGRLAIPPIFADVPRGFSEGYAAVTVAGEGGHRFGFIDSSGGFAMDSLFDAAGDFSGGVAPVGRGETSGGRFRGAWSYVDTSGARAFPGEWEWAGSFAGDRALVRGFDGAFALIDRKGAIAGRVPDSLRPEARWSGGIVTYTLRRAESRSGQGGNAARGK